MTLSQFNSYSTAARLEVIWEHGNLIAHRGRRGYRIALYNLGSFFAEIWYNPANDHVSLVRGYISKKVFEPYLVKIDLESLIEW